MRSRRIVMAAALVTAVVTSWAHDAAQKTSKERFQAKIAALKKAGEPVTMAEAAPPKVADEENAALVYQQAWEKWDALPVGVRKRLDDLGGRRDALSDRELDDAIDMLDDAEAVIELVRRAAAMKKCRFPLDYNGPSYAMLLPHLSKLQSTGRLMSLSAQVKVAQKKADAAMRDCVSGLRVGRACRDEPILISQLVDMAVTGMATQRLKETLDKLEPSEAVLRKVLDELADADDRAPYVRAIRGELTMGIDVTIQAVKDPRSLTAIRPGKSTFKDRLLGSMGSPWVYQMGVRYLETAEKYVAFTGKPWHAVKDDYAALIANLERVRREPRLEYALVTFLMPALEKAHLTNDAGIAHRQCARLAVALRLYRMKHGAYPEKLDALAPAFIPKLPTDPMSGKDYRYRREGKGFVVYSIGGNGIDDNGVHSTDIDEGDVAYRISR